MTISVKKSFVKDKFGHPLTSGLQSQNVDRMTNELNFLRGENKSLQEALEKVNQEYLEVKQELEVKAEHEQDEAHTLNADIKELESELSAQQEEVINIHSANEILKKKVLSFNVELSEIRTKTKREIDEVKKNPRKKLRHGGKILEKREERKSSLNMN